MEKVLRSSPFFLYVCTCLSFAEGQNLIENGSFEEGLGSWQASSGARVIDAGAGAAEGSHVLELDVPLDELVGYVTQDLTLVPDQEYELNYVHQRSFSETQLRLVVTLDSFSPYNVISGPFFSWSSPNQSLPSSPNWRQDSVRFFAKQTGSSLQFGPVTPSNGPVPGGKVWIDDIVVTAVGTNRRPGIDHDFLAFLPSEATVGETVELHVSCIDTRVRRVPNHMPVETAATIDVSTDDPMTDVPSEIVFAGEVFQTFPVTFHNPGVHRIVLSHSNGHLRSSNPIRVTDTEPDLRHYWGDLHIHTRYQHAGWWGGNGFENYLYARDIARLDFAALTEHYPASVGPSYIREMSTATQLFYDPGDFVTFFAVENKSFQGHHNNFLRAGNRFAMYDPRNAFTGEQDKLQFFRSQGTKALNVPHHFNLLDPTDWRLADRDGRTVVELYSNHGSSEISGGWWIHPDHVGSDYSATMGAEGHDYLSALARGYRLGVIASSDNHSARPGMEGLTCVATPDLRRHTVWDGIQARHCYATTNARILVDFEIQGTPMGDELFVATGTALNAAIRVNGTSELATIEVVSDGEVVQTFTPGELDFEDASIDLGSFSGETTYFYLRVIQEDEHRAWSSPIWVSPSLTPDLVLERKNLAFDHTANALIVSVQNYGDVTANTAVRVYSSAGHSALKDFQLLGDDLGVVARVEPLGSDRALVRLYLYIPTDHNTLFDFSGQIQIADAAGYSIVTDPRSMLMDDGNGTLTWDEGPYGYRTSGSASHSGRITDFTILVNTNANTTLTATFAENGQAITPCYLGDVPSAMPGTLDVPLGSIAAQTELAEVGVSIPPDGGRTNVRFEGLAPGRTYVAALDPGNLLPESDEHNNAHALAVPLTAPTYVFWSNMPEPAVRFEWAGDKLCASDQPQVSELTPSEGPASGNNTITIRGERFTPCAEVFFGVEPALSVTYVSKTELRVLVPPNRRAPTQRGSGGTPRLHQGRTEGHRVSVTVSNEGAAQVVPDGYTYLPTFRR